MGLSCVTVRSMSGTTVPHCCYKCSIIVSYKLWAVKDRFGKMKVPYPIPATLLRVRSLRCLMSLLSGAAANYIPVADIAAATAWYIEKLGLRKVNVELDDGEDCVALGFSKDDCAVCLGPVGRSSEEFTHMLNSSNLKKS